LATPTWTLPEGIIAAIWGTLFVTTVISLSSFFDTQTKSTKGFRTTVLLYMGNALLVILWNYLFFGIHVMVFALWAAIAVGVSVLTLIFRVKKVSRPAAWLLAPYLAWVAYAIAINYAVMIMN
jgi:benzodiazapine receptor